MEYLGTAPLSTQPFRTLTSVESGCEERHGPRTHQIFDLTCALPRTMMSTTARSKKLVVV